MPTYVVEVEQFWWHGETKPRGATFEDHDTVEIRTNLALGRIKQAEPSKYQVPPPAAEPPPPAEPEPPPLPMTTDDSLTVPRRRYTRRT